MKKALASILFLAVALGVCAPTTAFAKSHTQTKSPTHQTKMQKQSDRQWKKYNKQLAKEQKKQLRAQKKQMKKWNKQHQTTVRVT